MSASYPFGGGDIDVGLRGRGHAIGLVFSGEMLNADELAVSVLEPVRNARRCIRFSAVVIARCANIISILRMKQSKQEYSLFEGGRS